MDDSIKYSIARKGTRIRKGRRINTKLRKHKSKSNFISIKTNINIKNKTSGYTIRKKALVEFNSVPSYRKVYEICFSDEIDTYSLQIITNALITAEDISIYFDSKEYLILLEKIYTNRYHRIHKLHGKIKKIVEFPEWEGGEED